MMDTQTLSALPSRDRPYKVGVGGSLFLLVKPSGSKLWRFRYRVGGREKGLSLGVFPTVSLTDAAKARDRMKAQLRAGTDPTQTRQAERLARLKRLTEGASGRDLHLTFSKDGALTIGTGARRFRLTKRQTNTLRAFNAEEDEIAREKLGRLEQAVLDLTTRFQHLVPGLNAESQPIPANFLRRASEVSNGQIRQRHPIERILWAVSVAAITFTLIGSVDPESFA